MLAPVAYEEPAAHENVGWLQVAVYDELLVQVSQSERHLIAHQTQHTFGEMPSEKLGSLTILAVLHKDVVILAVFDVSVELDDVGVIQF
jgi:hypothetical protein